MAPRFKGWMKAMWNIRWMMIDVLTNLFAQYVTGKLSFTPSCAQPAFLEKCKVFQSPMFDGQLYMQPSFSPISYTLSVICQRHIQVFERAEEGSSGNRKSESCAWMKTLVNKAVSIGAGQLQSKTNEITPPKRQTIVIILECENILVRCCWSWLRFSWTPQ